MTQNKIRNNLFVLNKEERDTVFLLVGVKVPLAAVWKTNRLWEDHLEASVSVQVEMLTWDSSPRGKKEEEGLNERGTV